VSYHVRTTAGARADLVELFGFLAAEDFDAAIQARETIAKALDTLALFPFNGRKVESDNAFLREMVIPFGRRGYVALYEIEAEATVTLLAFRHQREADFD
jgi:plasmid stabilization system protein ParE